MFFFCDSSSESSPQTHAALFDPRLSILLLQDLRHPPYLGILKQPQTTLTMPFKTFAVSSSQSICNKVTITKPKYFQLKILVAQILPSYPIFGAFSSWTYRVQVFVFLFLCLISTFWPFWEIPCFNSWAYLHKYFQMQKYKILRDISCILN